jgi:cysteine synthase A
MRIQLSDDNGAVQGIEFAAHITADDSSWYSGETHQRGEAVGKDRNPAIQCLIVEPEGAAVLAAEAAKNSNQPIQGGGYSKSDLAFLNTSLIDGYLSVSGEQAADMTRDLARLEGIFGGFSAGANVAAALKLLEGSMRGRTIAVIICDSVLKYLSTELWG